MHRRRTLGHCRINDAARIDRRPGGLVAGEQPSRRAGSGTNALRRRCLRFLVKRSLDDGILHERPNGLVVHQRNAHGHYARTNRRQQRSGFARSQNDGRIGQRFFEQLQESVGGHVRSFLRHHSLGVANDKDLAASDRRRQSRLLHEIAHSGDINPLGS